MPQEPGDEANRRAKLRAQREGGVEVTARHTQEHGHSRDGKQHGQGRVKEFGGGGARGAGHDVLVGRFHGKGYACPHIHKQLEQDDLQRREGVTGAGSHQEKEHHQSDLATKIKRQGLAQVVEEATALTEQKGKG